MDKKLRVGIIGATGYVGQQFVFLLEDHPWFEPVKIAASQASAGKTYGEAVTGRWKSSRPIPLYLKDMTVQSIEDLKAFCDGLDFVFSAISLPKDETLTLEEGIAKLEVPVVSNNSACRMLPDVPMIIPEINYDHSKVIELQKKRLGTKRGFVTAKPNCSIQSYVPAITPLLSYAPDKISVCTYQAITGAGKTLSDAPEIINNVIPYIGTEEEKSETEPLKIWGRVTDNGIMPSDKPIISAQCYRVCVEDGHTAAVSVSFAKKPSIDEIINAWNNFKTEPERLDLPSAPKPFIRYLTESDRPQPALDVYFQGGMGITIGRLRQDNIFDYKFTCLSHNGIRGAAGGAVLTAELLAEQGYIIH